jgi:hypothetical protein
VVRLISLLTRFDWEEEGDLFWGIKMDSAVASAEATGEGGDGSGDPQDEQVLRLQAELSEKLREGTASLSKDVRLETSNAKEARKSRQEARKKQLEATKNLRGDVGSESKDERDDWINAEVRVRLLDMSFRERRAQEWASVCSAVQGKLREGTASLSKDARLKKLREGAAILLEHDRYKMERARACKIIRQRDQASKAWNMKHEGSLNSHAGVMGYGALQGHFRAEDKEFKNLMVTPAIQKAGSSLRQRDQAMKAWKQMKGGGDSAISAMAHGGPGQE